MTPPEPVLALALGALAALLHLQLTWRRALFCARGGLAPALLSLPIGIAAPALCLFASILVWPDSGWAALPGFWLVRSVALAKLGGS